MFIKGFRRVLRKIKCFLGIHRWTFHMSHAGSGVFCFHCGVENKEKTKRIFDKVKREMDEKEEDLSK